MIAQYKCNECGRQNDLAAFQRDDYTSDVICSHCDGEARYVGDRSPLWASLGVYFVTRQYGGPEEGGWWYDEGTLYKETLRCFQEGDFPQMEEYRQTLRRRFLESNVRVIEYHEEIVMEYPKRRPTYS